LLTKNEGERDEEKRVTRNPQNLWVQVDLADADLISSFLTPVPLSPSFPFSTCCGFIVDNVGKRGLASELTCFFQLLIFFGHLTRLRLSMPIFGRHRPRSSTSSSVPAELANSRRLPKSGDNSPARLMSRSASSSAAVTKTDKIEKIEKTDKEPDDDSQSSDSVFVDALEPPQAAATPAMSAASVASATSSSSDDDDLSKDLADIWRALDLFLDSRIREAEDICRDGLETRLYYSIGYSLIQAIKSLMTFEPSDFDSAIESCRLTIRLSTQLRPVSQSFYQSAARWARGAPSVSALRAMSKEARHAELIHAEAALLNAVLAILHSGDFIVIAREALSVRAALATYHALSQLLESDASAQSDADLLSGVYLGNGLLTLILSLLPAKVARVVELFGYSGDRTTALNTLRRGGMWGQDDKETPSDGGLRRPLCDCILLSYHLILSAYVPVDDADLNLAERILNYNLARYPDSASNICLIYQAHP
jgi:hypothetical protein